MAMEKFTLTWHSYASHFQEVLGNLFDTGESSDVTLVCDDQISIKANKAVLNASSSVFRYFYIIENRTSSIDLHQRNSTSAVHNEET